MFTSQGSFTKQVWNRLAPILSSQSEPNRTGNELQRRMILCSILLGMNLSYCETFLSLIIFDFIYVFVYVILIFD